MYYLYSDGGALGNPGVAGYGYVLFKDDEKIKEGGGCVPYGTNNQMEVLGCAVGLSFVPNGEEVIIYSDSQYLVRTMKGEYKKGKNFVFWDEIEKEVSRVKVVSWNWVKGHAENEHNNRCDELAQERMRRFVKDQKLIELNKKDMECKDGADS